MNAGNKQLLDECIKLSQGIFDPLTVRSYFYSLTSNNAESIYFPLLEKISNWIKQIDLTQSTSDISSFFVSLDEYHQAFVLHSIISAATLKLSYYHDERPEDLIQQAHRVLIPVLNQMSIQELKWRMEDFTMRIENPDSYLQLKQQLKLKRVVREQRVLDFMKLLHEMDPSNKHNIAISGRVKHIRGIYEKMKRRKRPHDQIFDQLALRIIVKSISDCYWWLAEIHDRWVSIKDEFDDYIKVPKPNGYQSLHTAVSDEYNNIFEIQIRTRDMDVAANFGLAAHWQYKHKQKHGNSIKKNENDCIHVLTPKGKIIALLPRSTGLDFAYRIHTDIGHHCQHVIVNGIIQKRSYELKNGDCVDIVTDKNVHPSWDWIQPNRPVVRTKSAVRKIAAFLRAKYSIPDEKSKLLIENQSSRQNKTTPIPRKETTIEISNYPSVAHRLAKCCNPTQGDECIGYMTLKRGLMIHKINCSFLPHVARGREYRFLSVKWKKK